MQTFFVINPSSAYGQTGRRWPELLAQLRAKLPGSEHAFTDSPMSAVRITREALSKGFDCVAAVGGDGTLNEVVNGFFAEGRPVRPGARLALVPRGTGGDFRRTFGWETDFDSALERVARGTTRPIDVGSLEFQGPDGKGAQRYFVNVCSFGASGVVDQEVHRSGKWMGGRLSFMVGSARALLKYSDRQVRVSLDGRAPELWDVTTLAVANGRYFGGGMMVAPEADPADGLFDVTLWSGYGLTDFVLKAPALYSGAHTRLPGTRTFRAQSVVAESDQEVLLDVDGEQPGRLPARFSMLKGALPLIV